MEDNRRDLKISGAGNGVGGTYDQVKISGAGDIDGDIECSVLKIGGAGEIKGNVKADKVRISGAGDIKGNLECQEAEISGAADVRGDVTADEIRISGGSDIKGSLKAQTVDVSGGIGIKGDCEAESFTASGAFDIGGLLNADNIDIIVRGCCNVSEMGGEKISVRADDRVGIIEKGISRMFKQGRGLICTVIEGDDVYLEETEAKTVRGNNVTIGKGCKIELVEYKNEINVYDEKSVKEVKKV